MLEKYHVKECDDEWPHYEKYTREYVEPFRALVDLDSWQPRRAKREFLERFEELNNDRLEGRSRQAA
jgi:hypothetical protein